MRHPNQATLALHAGGDLGRLARWRTARHLARCARCREEVAAYDGMRRALPGLGEVPEIPWNRLAMEMKANIRLGLAAGECVRAGGDTASENPVFHFGRRAVALAGVLVLLVAGVVLEHPGPGAARLEGPLVQATSNGIEVAAGGQTFGLINGGAQKATYSRDAQGSMEARYVDPETGYVTINTVYVQ